MQQGTRGGNDRVGQKDERVGKRMRLLDHKMSTFFGSFVFILIAMAAVDYLLPKANVPRWLTCVAAALVGILLWINSRRTYYEDLSARDSLTSLNNKRAYDEDLADLIRHKRPFCVFFLDVDRFKQINDNHGHDAGDIVLMDFASSIVSYTSKDECAYRVGGDEFVVVCSQSLDHETCARKASELERAVAHPVELWDGEIVPKVSVGYARFPEDGADGHEISAAADRMMYEFKERHHAAESEGFEVEDALERIQDFDLYQTIKCLPVPYVIYRVAGHLDILFANDAFLSIAGTSSLGSFVEKTLGALDAIFSEKDTDTLRHLVTTGETEDVGLRKNLVEMRCLDGVTRLLEFRAFGVDNSRGEAIVCAVVRERPSA